MISCLSIKLFTKMGSGPNMACWPCLLTPALMNQKAMVIINKLKKKKKKQWCITSEILLQTLASILPALSCPLACLLGWKPAAVLWAKWWRSPPGRGASSLQGTEALVPQSVRNWILLTTLYPSLEVDPSPVQLWADKSPSWHLGCERPWTRGPS